jgi:hypothetical protein
VARAAFQTKAEVERLVVSLQPRVAPREGLRKVPGPQQRRDLELLPVSRPAASNEATLSVPNPSTAPAPNETASCGPLLGAAAIESGSVEAFAPSALPSPARRADSPATLQPVAADTYSLRVTVDAAFKADLDTLKALLGHKVPSGDLGAVLREAVRCAIEKHGKRRGAVESSRHRAPAPQSTRDGTQPLLNDPEASGSVNLKSHAQPRASIPARAIPAAVRRLVWARDGGRCTFTAADGTRCGSRRQLELDHVLAVARGGTSTAANLTIRCRGHNLLRAEHDFGREHMASFRRGAPRTGEITISSGGGADFTYGTARRAGS